MHPHTAEWMQRCLAIEALEAMDTNDDSFVDEDEFLKVSLQKVHVHVLTILLSMLLATQKQ